MAQGMRDVGLNEFFSLPCGKALKIDHDYIIVMASAVGEELAKEKYNHIMDTIDVRLDAFYSSNLSNKHLLRVYSVE